MKRAAAVLCVLLTGCGALGGMNTVKVPVPVACQEREPDRPAMPTEALQPGGSLFVAVKTMQAEIEIRDGYEAQLAAALRACIAPLTSTRPPA